MKNTNKIRERNLTQILMDDDLLTSEQLTSVLEDRETTGELLIELILNNEYVMEEDLARSLVINYQLPFLYPQDCHIAKEAKEIIPTPLLHTHKLYPFDVFGDTVVIMTSGNIDEDIIQEVESTCQKEICFYLCYHSHLKKILTEEFPLDEITSELNDRMDELFGI
jgi:hypothetical protein